MNSGKGNIILLTIIAVATLLVAVAGATFAYFGATMNGSESPTTIEVTGGTLVLNPTDTVAINAGAVEPGAVLATKTFTVTGKITGSTNLNYNVNINVSNNTYQEGELVYTITSTNTSNNGTPITKSTNPVLVPTGKNIIDLGKGAFAGPATSGVSHTYTLTITRKADANKLENPNPAFSANLEIAW